MVKVLDVVKFGNLINNGELNTDLYVYINNLNYFNENVNYKEFKSYCKKLKKGEVVF